MLRVWPGDQIVRRLEGRNYSPRQWTKDPKGNSEIIRPAPFIAGPECKAWEQSSFTGGAPGTCRTLDPCTPRTPLPCFSAVPGAALATSVMHRPQWPPLQRTQAANLVASRQHCLYRLPKPWLPPLRFQRTRPTSMVGPKQRAVTRTGHPEQWGQGCTKLWAEILGGPSSARKAAKAGRQPHWVQEARPLPQCTGKQDLCSSASGRWEPCPSGPGGQNIKPKIILEP